MNQREKELLELRANKNAEEHAKQAAIAAQAKAKADKDKANEKRIAAKMAKINSRKLKGTEEVVLLKNASSFNRISSYRFCPVRLAHDGTIVASIKGTFKKIY